MRSLNRVNAIAAKSQRAGLVMAAGGAGAAFAGQRLGAGMMAVAQPAVDLQTQVRDIGITAGFNDAQEAQLRARIRADALAFGQFADKIGEGLGVLTANGITDMKQLQAYSAVLAKTSVASNAEMSDLGQLIVSLQQLKVTTTGMPGALDALSYAGKRGSFELKDMAEVVADVGADDERSGDRRSRCGQPVGRCAASRAPGCRQQRRSGQQSEELSGEDHLAGNGEELRRRRRLICRRG